MITYKGSRKVKRHIYKTRDINVVSQTVNIGIDNIWGCENVFICRLITYINYRHTPLDSKIYYKPNIYDRNTEKKESKAYK